MSPPGLLCGLQKTQSEPLKAGIPVKVISERLGHENPAFTMKQYAHVIPGMQAEAARLVASLVGGPVDRT